MSTTVVAIPGFGCPSEMYLEQKVQFPHFYYPDNFGFNEAPSAASLGLETYTLKDQADYHLKKIDELFGVDTNLVLLGTSMGGFVAQEMAKLSPKRIKGMIFMCSIGPTSNGFVGPTPLTKEGLYFYYQLPKTDQATFGTSGTVHPSLKEKNPSQYEKIWNYRLNTNVDVNAVVNQNEAAIAFLNSTFDYSTIKHIPVIALHGSDDRFIKRENAEIFKKYFDNCETHYVEEADHFFFMEKPEITNSYIKKFVDTVGA